MQSAYDQSSIFQRLKNATAQLHQQIETRLEIFSPSFDLAGYSHILRCFYGYWAPIESVLSGVVELRDANLDFLSRRKTHLLESDLQFFGVDPVFVARCSRLPEVSTLARSFGCLYVLEGSTLGSQLIARHLRARFQLDRGCGASFFNAYGQEVGTRWAEFRSFLLLHTNRESENELVSAARETFETLDGWLSR